MDRAGSLVGVPNIICFLDNGKIYWCLGLWTKRSKFVSWSDRSTVAERRHTTPEGSQLNSSCSGDISTINFYDNRPRTHRERGLWWWGQWWVGLSKKIVSWSNRSTVTARSHTTPEGSQLNSSCSGDISTINFYDNRPRTHQERWLWWWGQWWVGMS